MSIRPEKVKELADKMTAAGLLEEDLEEKFIRAQGRGGQKVNKTSVCVYLKHRPSGLEVKCQKERSQAMNRFFARRILLEKFESQILGKQTKADEIREKIRKQKKRRARRRDSSS